MKLALAGDTMLGRGVADPLAHDPKHTLLAPELVEIISEADLFLLNLKCCISVRGEPRPGRVFQRRAPPWTADALAQLGVHCVTLANNHALDFGSDALLDTLTHLEAAGIRVVGAGADSDRARAPPVFDTGGFHLAVVGFSDHPTEYAAGANRPGIAYADLGRHLPDWLTGFPDAEAVLVAPGAEHDERTSGLRPRRRASAYRRRRNDRRRPLPSAAD